MRASVDNANLCAEKDFVKTLFYRFDIEAIAGLLQLLVHNDNSST